MWTGSQLFCYKCILRCLEERHGASYQLHLHVGPCLHNFSSFPHLL